MEATAEAQPTVIRTERGLSIAGTRITLYDIMDYVTAGWPSQKIRDWLNLTDQQITEVMEYIHVHREEVEAEYREVLQAAQENQHYWETRNRERFAQIATLPSKPGQEPLREKLRLWETKIESSR
jgi:hypothetical protein